MKNRQDHNLDPHSSIRIWKENDYNDDNNLYESPTDQPSNKLKDHNRHPITRGNPWQIKPNIYRNYD